MTYAELHADWRETRQQIEDFRWAVELPEMTRAQRAFFQRRLGELYSDFAELGAMLAQRRYCIAYLM